MVWHKWLTSCFRNNNPPTPTNLECCVKPCVKFSYNLSQFWVLYCIALFLCHPQLRNYCHLFCYGFEGRLFDLYGIYLSFPVLTFSQELNGSSS